MQMDRGKKNSSGSMFGRGLKLRINVLDAIFLVTLSLTVLGVNFYSIRPLSHMVFAFSVIYRCRYMSGFTFSALNSRAVFIAWCLISYIWARYPNVVINYIPSVAQSIFLFPAVLLYIEKAPKRRLKMALLAFILLSAILCLWVFLSNPPSVIMQSGRSARDRITANGINPNQISVCCSYSVLLLVAYYREHLFRKLIWLCIPMVVVVILTGSKKGVFTLLIGLTLVALTIPNNTHRRLTLLILPVALTTILLLINSRGGLVYRLLGKRIKGFIDYILSGEGDKSTNSRGYMIGLAWSLFRKHPLTGIGLHNFKQVNIYGVYAHNNYMELLACLGLPGFVLYYWSFIGYIKRAVKEISHGLRKIGVEHVLILCIMLNEYATVSYTNEVFQMVMGLAVGFRFIDNSGLLSEDIDSDIKQAEMEASVQFPNHYLVLWKQMEMIIKGSVKRILDYMKHLKGEDNNEKECSDCACSKHDDFFGFCDKHFCR